MNNKLVTRRCLFSFTFQDLKIKYRIRKWVKTYLFKKVEEIVIEMNSQKDKETDKQIVKETRSCKTTLACLPSIANTENLCGAVD